MKNLSPLLAGALIAFVVGDCLGIEKIVNSDCALTFVEPVRVPRGPAGDWPKAVCMELLVSIEADGRVSKVNFVTQSRHWPFNRAVYSALLDSRFVPVQASAATVEKTIFVDYSGEGTAVDIGERDCCAASVTVASAGKTHDGPQRGADGRSIWAEC